MRPIARFATAFFAAVTIAASGLPAQSPRAGGGGSSSPEAQKLAVRFKNEAPAAWAAIEEEVRDLHGKLAKTLVVRGKDPFVRDDTYWFDADLDAGRVELDARHLDGPPSVFGYNGEHAFEIWPNEAGAYMLGDFQPRGNAGTPRVVDTVAQGYLTHLLAAMHAGGKDLRGLFDPSMDGFDLTTDPSFEVVDSGRAGGPLLRVHYRGRIPDGSIDSEHRGWATVDPSRDWAVVEWKETFKRGSNARSNGGRIAYQTTPQGRPFPKRIYEYSTDAGGTTTQEETIEYGVPTASDLGEEGYQLSAYGIEPPAELMPDENRTPWITAGVLVGIGVIFAVAAIVYRRRRSAI